MKIWFTEIGEPLPLEKDARLHRYGNLTRFLAGRGHEVIWWTSSFSHAVKRAVCEGGRDYSVNGVTLRVFEGPGYRRNVSLARFRHQSDFARKFYQSAPGCALPDVIVTPIPTIEAATLAVKFGKERGVPVLVDIRDEWPDDLINLAPKPLRRLGKMVLASYVRRMRALCRDAAGVIGISRRQLQHGLKYAGRAQGATDGVFPIGYPGQAAIGPEKLAAAHEWWRAQGVSADAFVICFFGTIGRFFTLETAIEAGRRLSGEFPVQFVLCGDGSSLEKYRRQASQVPSVLLPGWVDAPKIAALMQLADAGLAPYASDAQSMSLPNKPFEYFSGGLPVISSIEHGELRELLDTNRCGLTYNADNADELCDIIRELWRHPEECEQMGASGRRLLETRFTSENIFAQLESHLMALANLNGSPRPSPKKRNQRTAPSAHV